MALKTLVRRLISAGPDGAAAARPEQPLHEGVRLVGMGHSHVFAIKAAAAAYQADLASQGVRVETIRVGDEPHRDYRVRSLLGGTGGFDWSADMLAEIGKADAEADLVFSCFGGNAHNILGLVRHPRPYDFVLEDEPERPMAEDAEIVPAALIEDALAKQGGFPETIWCLRALRQAYRGTLVHCESPPQIPSEAHLLKYAGVFKEKFDQFGVAPAELRYKLWRLHSRLIRRECDALGILFLDAPPEMVDAQGFLVEPAWNPDTTHGNAVYGMAVIRQLTALVHAAPAAGVTA
jgi:hypothetical protein